jgi:hypothetical protein
MHQAADLLLDRRGASAMTQSDSLHGLLGGYGRGGFPIGVLWLPRWQDSTMTNVLYGLQGAAAPAAPAAAQSVRASSWPLAVKVPPAQRAEFVCSLQMLARQTWGAAPPPLPAPEEDYVMVEVGDEV